MKQVHFFIDKGLQLEMDVLKSQYAKEVGHTVLWREFMEYLVNVYKKRI
jgi:hypothetical protein